MMGNTNCDTCGHDTNMCTCKKPVFVAQEGGEHYQAEYQHWDWVIDAGLGYLEGCATKYVSRWWKKNGLQDLAKAKTYVLKMITNYDAVYALSIEAPDNIDELNARFCKANKLPELEYQFCVLMSDWQSTQQLEFALQLLDSLIATAQKALEAGAVAGVVVGAGKGASPALPLLCGAVAGAMGQAAPTNTSTELALKAFGPCPCGCGRPRAKNMHYATETCKKVDGMEHPFGYDAWAEGPIQE